MNKSVVKWLLILLLLLGIIIGAVVLYENLSDGYSSGYYGDDDDDNKYKPSNQKGEFSAPDFTVLDESGREVNLSDFAGKPIVVNFWATWCYYCKEEMPDFNKAYKEYPEVQFVMVNATDGYQETVEVAQDYVDDNNFKFDIFFDTESDAIDAYKISGFPTTLFINEDGELVKSHIGMIDYSTLTQQIEKMLE